MVKTKRYRKTRNKRNTRNSRKKGGKVLDSGGYGCVFYPSLKCKSSSRSNKVVSKLMIKKYTILEYNKIRSIYKLLRKIKDYKKYFLIFDINTCQPDTLSRDDIHNFDDKCSALKKNNITQQNINQNLSQLMILNMPFGGIPVDDYIWNQESLANIFLLHSKLFQLLEHGIIPMNNLGIYHSDIKGTNVLMDKQENMRLIDWGLTVEYNEKTRIVPKYWQNRPFQFNVPFSIILFTDMFKKQYTEYLANGSNSIQTFVQNYIKDWMKQRGQGHYKVIHEIMFKLFSNDDDIVNMDEREKSEYIQTNKTFPIIVNNIVQILTRHADEKDPELYDYLNKSFIKIIDIWGFISIYYSVLEMLFNNYSTLTENQLNIFNTIKRLFLNYLYIPKNDPINMIELKEDMNELGDLLKNESSV